MKYKDYFKGKRVTVMGLGLLGRGIGVIKFLAECGADLIVTDLKTQKELESSLKKLTTYHLPPITYVLGQHRLEDFRNRDFIIRAPNAPLDSIYLAEARKNNIPIEMDASLFTKIAWQELGPENIKIVGVTGTRGKSTVTHLLYEILKKHNPRTFLAGNVRGTATLPLLKKIRKGDTVVMELDSWQLQGFGEAKISPQISIFTTFLPDHLNYYKGDMEHYFADKENIYKYQKPGDVLIAGTQVVKSRKLKVKSIGEKDWPEGWKLKMPGQHNQYNAALALAAARKIGVPDSVSKKVSQSFAGLPGRLQFVCSIKGVKYYNDTTSTTPDSLLAALKAIDKKVILIMGGASKNLPIEGLALELPKYCKHIILLPGTGTDKLKSYKLKAKSLKEVENLPQAIKEATRVAKRGDVVLLSPAFASFGLFKNEFDRGDQFVKVVKKLK